ncbi:MAG: hypothetical protein ABUL62_06990 [Myxococcales bacterium]
MLEFRDDDRLAFRRWPAWCLLFVFTLFGCQVLFGHVDVRRKAQGGPDSCTAGDYRCNGEYLLTCGSADTGWMLEDSCASQDLCDAKAQRCAVCRDGDFRCNGADRQQCASDGASWKTVEHCEAENQCSESSCGTCPTEGALDCSSGSKLRECHNGVWQELDTCASAAVCSATISQAMELGATWDRKCSAPTCSPGAYDCTDATLRRCRLDQSGWDEVDTCVSAALCAATVAEANGSGTAPDGGMQADAGSNAGAIIDACKMGCPAPGAYFCDGATLEQCSADQVGYQTVAVCPANTECDPKAGTCGELCTPGHFQCNAASLRKCGPDGHWKAESECETPALCNVNADGTQGKCDVSPCGSEVFRCTGAALEKCKADRTGYQPAETCASAALCDAKSQRCLAPVCPVAAGYQCFGQDLKQCASDLTKWNPVTTCPVGQYCDSGAQPGCLTSCPANPLRCNGKVLEQCSAATGWVAKATCATADLCSCTQTNPPSCAKGLFKDGCGNAACGGSTLPTYQCQGTTLQKCQAGRNGWDTVSDCGSYIWPPNQNLCYAGTAPAYDNGYCLTCPVAGELSCTGSTLQSCSADRRSWNTSANCGTNGCVAQTLADDYCAVCKAGDVRCSGATLQTCPDKAKAWTSTTCKSAALCDVANRQCDVCNATVCSGTTLQVCSADGQTVTSSSCATTALCNAAKAKCDAPVCAVGQKTCDGATLKICNAGRTGYDVLDTCASAALCNTTTFKCDTQVCAANQKRCNGAQLQTCNATLTGYDAGVACASAALCNSVTLMCDAATCAANATRCSGAKVQTCSADLTHWVDGATCANGCSGGACNACGVGEHRCSGQNSQVCKSDQSGFVNETACGTVGCNSTTGLCNACSVGEKQCKGSNLQVCSADQSGFVNGTDCGAPGCNAVTKTCNAQVCTPGSSGCDGLNHQKCNATGTAWTTDLVCVLTCDPMAGCTECDPTTAPSCTANVLKTCSAAGHWVTTDCGTNVCNPAGSCDPPPPGPDGGT